MTSNSGPEMDNQSTPSQNSSSPQSTPPTSGAATALNPISCIVCRRRKVRCDRRLGSCSNCSKGETPCIYPASLRATRRKEINQQYLNDANREAMLLDRLKKMENMIAVLTNHKIDDSAAPDFNSNAAGQPPIPDDDENEGLNQALGKMIVDGGQSRYISSSVWDSLSKEVEDMKDIYALSPDSEDHDTTELGDMILGQGLFGIDNVVDLQSLRPMISQVSFFWHWFVKAIDPLLKVIHQPTVHDSITALVSNQMRGMTPEMEVLMFAIYFSVIMSMSPENVFGSFREAKSTLSARYRYGFEKALSQADFHRTQDLMVVQALVIFLIFAKIDDPRYVWTMTATVIRISQFIGLHRDGTTFGLPPFETEMRRRTWWWVWGLDLRTAEDYGTDPIISNTSFDTRLPLNIEDSDINPHDKNYPTERQSFTAMSNFLMRCALMGPTTTKLYSAPVAERVLKAPSYEELEASVKKCELYLEKTWLPRCDVENDTRAWLSTIMAQIVILKMKIWIYKPRPGAVTERTQVMRDKLFVYTLEVMELENIGMTNPRTEVFKWWWQSICQWGAMAFVLTELCFRSNSPEVTRAWGIIDRKLEVWNMAALEKQSLGHKKGSVWFSIKKLLVKANNKRMNDETPRAQNMHVTEALQENEMGDSFLDPPGQPSMTWDLLDDFQVSMLDIDSTYLNHHNPVTFTNNWPYEADPGGSDFTMPFTT